MEWDAPDNAGRPAITDYDVEYRRTSETAWTNHTHDGPGLSTTLTNLSPGTDYQVRVLARNHEGQGPWSNPAQGTTVANRPPVFGANTAGRSVPENSPQGTNVGAAVTATDTDDTLTYSLGGADSGSFEIDNGGQITVGEGTVLDHETGQSYTVTVTATDPHEASASIEVTITVTDVAEPPGPPDSFRSRSDADLPNSGMGRARQRRPPRHHRLRRRVPADIGDRLDEPHPRRTGPVHHTDQPESRHRLSGAGTGPQPRRPRPLVEPGPGHHRRQPPAGLRSQHRRPVGAGELPAGDQRGRCGDGDGHRRHADLQPGRRGLRLLRDRQRRPDHSGGGNRPGPRDGAELHGHRHRHRPPRSQRQHRGDHHGDRRGGASGPARQFP